MLWSTQTEIERNDNEIMQYECCCFEVKHKKKERQREREKERNPFEVSYFYPYLQ